jgi:uncharacterized membrane protein (DUF2068 family)
VPSDRSTGLTLLAIEKSIGALFFLTAGITLLVLDARNITHPLQSVFAEELGEDPHDFVANLLISLLPQVSRSALLTLALISAGYLLLHVLEAAGLWLRQLWVEYLILIETAAFLPYELYELVRHPTAFKAVILVVNVLIVGYLASRRLQPRRTLGSAYCSARDSRSEPARSHRHVPGRRRDRGWSHGGLLEGTGRRGRDVRSQHVCHYHHPVGHGSRKHRGWAGIRRQRLQRAGAGRRLRRSRI